MSMLTAAAALTAGGIAAAFVATLIGRESTLLYAVCAAAAGAGLLLMLLQLVGTYRSEGQRSGERSPAWYALAPMAIVVSLLGVAASGASCGVACIAWGTPAAAAVLAAPDIRGWCSRRQPLRRAPRA